MLRRALRIALCLTPLATPAIAGEALAPRTPWTKPDAAALREVADAAVIYVKFVDDSPIALERGAPSPALDDAARAALGALPASAWAPVYDLDAARLDDIRDRAQRSLGRALADLKTEFFVVPAPGRAGEVLQRLNALDVIEVALPMPRPAPPPLPPDFVPNQGYLHSAPVGVGAMPAWTELECRGEGVAIADLEYVYDTTHLDLPDIENVGVNPVDPGFGVGHGTAVLGQLAAIDNGWGVTGIAPNADVYFAGTFNGQSWNIASAIVAATNAMAPGDIILIEQQYPGPNNGEYVPIEWFPPWHNAVVTAVGNGMVVVMAAGNGGQNLDAPIFSTGNGGHWPFLPENDSGAIIVGAGVAGPGFGVGTPRARLSFSTYGSRVNLQGWGQSVWTTGYGGAYDDEGPSLYFTSSFSGTSSASPIVAGACALVQSVYKARNDGATLTSRQMRDLLVSTGLPQQDGSFPASQNIGPLPNVAAAVVAIVGASCPGDANGDNVVNFSDLVGVLSDFGQSGPALPHDLDGDGQVGFPDLNVVLANFGVACN